MSKLLAGVIAALLVGVGVAAASSLTTNDDPTRTSTVSTLDSTGTTETTGATETTETTETGEDISGPCDEPEHANDPRCTGAGTATRADGDDDRGRNRGSGRRGGDDERSGRGRGGADDDRSGSNSGRG
jgi:hypothetical protein